MCFCCLCIHSLDIWLRITGVLLQNYKTCSVSQGGFFFFLLLKHVDISMPRSIFTPSAVIRHLGPALSLSFVHVCSLEHKHSSLCVASRFVPPPPVTFWVSPSTQSPSLFPVNEKTLWCSPSELLWTPCTTSLWHFSPPVCFYINGRRLFGSCSHCICFLRLTL